MADVFSVQGSLPDQIHIVQNSSAETVEDIKISPHDVKSKIRKKLDTILKPKYVKPRYFTAGINVTEENARDFNNEPSPFEFPKDIEEFAHKVLNKAWRNDVRIKELQKKVSQRPSYTQGNKKDMLQRLYVKQPNIVEGKSMLKIDPNYYSVVSGRPINDQLSIRDYIETVRNSLRTKIITGYREDDIMLIDETMQLEQTIIDTVKENLQEYVNMFEDFLVVDHKSAMKLLQDCSTSSVAADEKYMEYKAIASKYAVLRSSLYTIEEKWKQSKTYQKFLYNVSPLTWRMQQESKKRRASIFMMEQQHDDLTGIFGNCRLSLVEKGLSVEDIISEFREEISNDKPPQLYFANPEQLLDVFRFIEMQNLYSLLYSEELAIPLANIKHSMQMAVEIFDREIKHLVETIDKLEIGISWEEQRVTYLEELSIRLITQELKELLMAENVLNLYVFVEDIYESILGLNDANLSIYEMMRAVEEKYRCELLLLDKVPSDQVAQLEGNYYKEEMVIMKLAERAAKQFEGLEKITASLKKAYTEPPQKIGKETKQRSPPLKQPLEVEEHLPRSLTSNEKEFLEFFTDFCEHTDDPIDYGINPIVRGRTRGQSTIANIGDLDKNLKLFLQ